MASRGARAFSIRFERAAEGGYVVSIPEMPGCVTQAESFEEGLAMIKDALEGLLHVALEHGDPVPEALQGLSVELVKNAQRPALRAGRGRPITRSKAG